MESVSGSVPQGWAPLDLVEELTIFMGDPGPCFHNGGVSTCWLLESALKKGPFLGGIQGILFVSPS